MAKRNESAMIRPAIQALYAMGCYVWRQNTGRARGVQYGVNGCADIIGLTRSGRFIGVELKFGKNKQQPEQERFQQRVEEKNGIYILAYSLDDITKHAEAIL